MDRGKIYKKSAQGSQAIAARDRALTPRQRALLILVDGKRENAELARLIMQQDVEPLMDQLMALGMLEEAGVSAEAPRAVPAAAAPAPAGAQAAHAVTLIEAQRFAVRRLTDMLGPGAEDMCIKIESTRNAADFMAVVQRVEEILRQVRGPEHAAAFAEAVASHRPG
jgi:hypothetical protein